MASDAEKVMAEMYRKADALKVNEPGLTREQAFVRVLEAEPGLYQEYDASREAARQANAETDGRPIGPARKEHRAQWWNDWSKKKVWVDPEAFFLGWVLNVKPEAEEELRQIVKVDGPERDARLRTWAEALNLTADWCIEKAVSLVADPRTLPVVSVAFSFESEGPRPLSSFERQKEKKRIRREFNRALDQHFDKMQDEIRRTGALDPADNLNAARFYWAARYQCNGESAQTIADYPHGVYASVDAGDPGNPDKMDMTVGLAPPGQRLNRQTVDSAVDDVLSRIGLTKRRPLKSGRPSTQRNTQTSRKKQGSI